MRVFLALVCLVLTGCNRQEKKVIGVVPKGANHIFWLTVKAGAEKALQGSGYEMEWKAPDLEIDASRQIAIVESMVNRHVAGIVLAPVHSRSLVGIVERAEREGIPVALSLIHI